MGGTRWCGEICRRRATPDVISFSAAISACERGQQRAEAHRLLGEMLHRLVAPDVISFSAAISA